MSDTQPALLSRRALLKLLGVTGVAIGSGSWTRAVAAVRTAPGDFESTWPALTLKIGSPPADVRPDIDLKRDFGALGDGLSNDGPAWRGLAAAVNAGQVAAGSLVSIPAGHYRVLGEAPVVFRRPVVLRGAGVGLTVLQPEYTEQGSRFIRVEGQGNYVQHSAFLYNGTRGSNRYPTAPFSSVLSTPRRCDDRLAVERPEIFSPGDQAYVLCDDYGPEIRYSTNNARAQHYLLKQYVQVIAVEGAEIVLDAPLRHDFVGLAPRLYRRQPVAGFGLEHLTIDDRSEITDSEALTTFTAVDYAGVTDGWVWDVEFLNSTSMPLTIGHSRHTVVTHCLFDGARHVGGGGNGYLPQIYYSDDCLVEYCTALRGRHALIANWTCWGNVFRFNQLLVTPNTETHGEYNVENLYLRNDCRGSLMYFGGGGSTHAHDGPRNELRENYARALQVLRADDRDNRLTGNWHIDAILDRGAGTVIEDNQRVPPEWDEFPFAAQCGRDHLETAESSLPDL